MTDTHVVGLYLVLAVALVIGAIVGLRMARGQKEWLGPIRPWHTVLVYLWTVGVLGAYPSFAAEHARLPFIRFPLIMMTITLVVVFVSAALWSAIFSAVRRVAEAYSRRMARF